MNYFDVVSLFVILAASYYGFKTGIITSLFCFFAGFTGIWVANQFNYGSLTNFYIFFILTAAAVLIGGFILNNMVIRKYLTNFMDRIGGSILGVFSGFVMVSLFLIPLSSNLPRGFQKLVTKSYSSLVITPFIEDKVISLKPFKEKKFENVLPMPRISEKFKKDLEKKTTAFSKKFNPFTETKKNKNKPSVTGNYKNIDTDTP
jgi:uncharacterized membrane protein required for colicin V production